jgi:hypothetical protein
MHGKITLKNNGEAEYICTMMSLIKAAKQMTPVIYESKVITGQLKQELNRAFEQFDLAIRNMIAKAPESAKNIWHTHYTEDQQDLAELYELIAPIPAEGKSLIVKGVKDILAGRIKAVD